MPAPSSRCAAWPARRRRRCSAMPRPGSTRDRRRRRRVVRLPGRRRAARAVGRAAPARAAPAARARPRAWQWLEVRSGIVTIEPATVDSLRAADAQLRVVGGVNFKKGCYPGQEVVARSQFRGTLKRRTFLFEADADRQRRPGRVCRQRRRRAGRHRCQAAPAPGGGGGSALSSAAGRARRRRAPPRQRRRPGAASRRAALPGRGRRRSRGLSATAVARRPCASCSSTTAIRCAIAAAAARPPCGDAGRIAASASRARGAPAHPRRRRRRGSRPGWRRIRWPPRRHRAPPRSARRGSDCEGAPGSHIR